MAKKSQKHEANAKAVIQLLIVILAFGLFLLFYTNKDEILASGSFKSFITLAAIAMGFLIGLLYLLNPSKSSKKRR